MTPLLSTTRDNMFKGFSSSGLSSRPPSWSLVHNIKYFANGGKLSDKFAFHIDKKNLNRYSAISLTPLNHNCVLIQRGHFLR
jgi:hypothetical protein